MQATASLAPPSSHEPVASPKGTLLVLGLTLVLLLTSWAGLSGYQLADSVEYMERAQALVRGQEVIDSTSIRSFGFVSLLAPIFLVADWLGVQDFQFVVGLVRVLQMLIGLELVRVCIFLGTRSAGRGAGLFAGCFVGFNPVFLQFAVSPVSGIAAAVCVGHALLNLTVAGDARRSLRAGMWLGGSILMAYQTILVSAALVGAALLRDRWRHRYAFLALCGGLGIGIFAAALLDRLCYGAWGESLFLYFRQNFGGVAARVLNSFGFTQAARDLYEITAATFEDEKGAHQMSTAADVRQMQSRFFYFTHLHEFLVWPFLASFLLGLAAASRKLRWSVAIPGLALGLCALLMGYKGSQDFRLWLPLLPLIAIFAALGWKLIVGPEGASAWRVRVGLVLVAAGAVLGWMRLGGNTTARYSGYWNAMELVNELAAEREGGLRAASAWHWAVFLRDSKDVELIKLPHYLDGWEGYDEAERAADFAALADVDAFVTHFGVLMPRPELFALFAREFEVAGMFFDHETYRDVGPILVFVRPEPGAERRSVLLEELANADVDAYRQRHDLGEGRRLVQAPDQHAPDQLRLLGVELRELPGDGHYWLTWHWLAEAPLTENYMLFEEFGEPEASARWRWTRQLGHGIAPSSTWAPGTIVREGWPLILAQDALDPSLPWQGLLDARLSERPFELWMKLGTLHPELGFLHQLLPAAPGGNVPAVRGPDGLTPEGDSFDERGFLLVDIFDLP
ncbi:MAG: hypothetical protein H6831_16455 [Planctomycetes bacterium]|nr:hypothetical protein [Planctomycetota bacterium]MCB9905993.1 hypothetical protein [Planctomycetota bacterium]